MSDDIDLQQVEQNARRAFLQDGLVYLFLGLLLIVVSISFLNTELAWLGAFGAFLIFPVQVLRKRVTFPRIGYAKLETPPGMARGMLLFMLAAVIALSAVAFLASRLMPVVISIVFALAFYFGASLNGIRLRDWLIIGLILIGGVVTAVSFADWHMATAVQFWFTGALLVVMGAVDFIRFLRKYPFAVDQGDI